MGISGPQRSEVGSMVAEFEIWGVAKIFVERLGTDAPIHAAMRADKLLDPGDLDGAAGWTGGAGALRGSASTRQQAELV